MFSIKRMNLRYIDGDEGGQVSAQGSTGETNALGGSISQGEPEGNPAWHEHLEKFPESVRHIARDTFAEWDKQTQGRFTAIHDQYKPYKALADQGATPEKLEAAYGLANMLETDPQGFARLLVENLGMTIQEANAAAEELSGQENPPAGADEEEDDPRIVALQEQVNQLLTATTERERAQQEAQIAAQQEQALTQEFAELESKHGKMTDPIKSQVLREAYRISVTENRPVTMQEAYDSLEQFVQHVRAVPRPGQLAPRVLSGGNSVPVTPPEKSLGKLTGNETRAYVAELAARAIAGQQS